MYSELEPLTYAELQNQYALAIFCQALGMTIDEINEYVRDSEDGPGWSMLLDLERAPEKALPWLAQFVGVRIAAGLTDQQQRDWIAGTANWRRGTLAAMTAAVQATLSGSKQVIIRERFGGAYKLNVVTYKSETPPEDIDSKNYLWNSNFEVNDTDGMSYFEGSTHSRVTNTSKFGAACMLLVGANTGLGGRADFYGGPAAGPEYSSTRVIAVPGQTWTGSVYVKRQNGNRRVRLEIEWRDSGFAQISVINGGYITPSATEFQRIEMTQTAPATTANITLRLHMEAGGAATDSVYVDGAQLELQPFATPYIETNSGPVTDIRDDGPAHKAIRSQKPAGLALDYNVLDGQDFQSLLDNHPTFQDVLDDYDTFQDVVDDTP
jgi:hypothetical protein